ncbi:MAG: mandelate racemase/muconate lactonizing enzyme family protein [Celeribacter sp.]|jgi:L-alanine-DL-glutamate epimerase-like enolase superfamily enzyme
MKITTIREADLPITSPGANAVVDFAGLTTSAVAIVSNVMRNGKPVTGYGFGSIGRWAEGGVLRDRFIPRLINADPESLLDEAGVIDPLKCAVVAMRNEKPGGHGGRAAALGALDMALWDLVAKVAGKPLYRVLAERFNNGQTDPDIAVYAAGGYYNGGAQGLRDEIAGYLDHGYREVKIKVGAVSLAEDMARIDVALSALDHDGSRLSVDANGRFEREEALAFGRAIAPLGLRWYEEPGDPLDYTLMAALAEDYPSALATGENLFSHQDARNLMRHGGMRPDRDFLQFDAGLSYGLSDYLKTLEVMDRMGWSRRRLHPHGGHQMSLHIAAGLGLGGNESYPGVFQPLGGFADQSRVENGRVTLPEEPGIGLELKAELWTWLVGTFGTA